MLHGFLSKLGAGITAITMIVTGLLHPAHVPAPNVSQLQNQIAVVHQQLAAQMLLGATIPKVVGVFETSLASKITSSATTMTLTTGTDKAGTALSGYIGFVLDEGGASEEFVACTTAATALTGCIRGIDPVDGDLEVTALKKEHRRGASVKITTYPVLSVIARILNGDETVPNVLTYSSSSPSFITSAAQLASKAYVDQVATSGAPAASPTTAGISLFSTLAQFFAGTATSTYNGQTYTLFPKNSFFNSTTTATTTGVVTQPNGKISQGFLDLSQTYAWTGQHTFATSTTFSASTTINATTTHIGNTSFSQIPTTTTTAPTTSNQLITKSYADTAYSNAAASSTSVSIAVGATAATTTVTVGVSGTALQQCTISQASDAQTHTYTLRVDSTSDNAITLPSGAAYNGIVVQELWQGLSNASHIFKVVHTSSGSTAGTLYCTVFSL